MAIYWKDLPKHAKVELKGSKGSQSYEYNGQTIYWNGNESHEAQKALNGRLQKVHSPEANRIARKVMKL